MSGILIKYQAAILTGISDSSLLVPALKSGYHWLPENMRVQIRNPKNLLGQSD
jgi:hypothetical protein